MDYLNAKNAFSYQFGAQRLVPTSCIKVWELMKSHKKSTLPLPRTAITSITLFVEILLN